MIISDEQVSRVCEYLHSGSAYSVTSHDSWTPPDKEFVDSVVAWICSLPDVREERVQEARRRMTQRGGFQADRTRVVRLRALASSHLAP
jgi:hypothetical protein